jgi:Predicted Na+-dependent transporter
MNREIIKKVCDLISGNVAALVLTFALIALFCPCAFSFIHPSAINWMLGVIMFGMGLTLKPNDFKQVFSHPQKVFIGCMAQFTIMPAMAWTLCRVFNLPVEIAVGVILVGCCPGGTASNVITYLAKGDFNLY